MQPVRTGALALASVGACSIAGCSGVQSSLSPAGPQAALIAGLTWVFITVCATIWLAVIVVLAVAVLRRRSLPSDPLAVDARRERRAGTIIALCTAATAAIVIVLTIVSFFTQRRLFAANLPAPTLQVTGHQWWWEVQYAPQSDQQFSIANEIYIPVQTSVRVQLKTADVIHSFWVPSLAGKMDQITGQENELRLSASRPGVYRGQCAEFCGKQHAKMALFVNALPRQQFNDWEQAQARPAAMPTDPAGQAGMQAFFTRGCMLCHTIRGSNAGGRLGPDLTHFGTRKTIAAGTLPNTPANLGGWIADPQHVKPGAQMPAMALDGRELSSLVAFLEGLQ